MNFKYKIGQKVCIKEWLDMPEDFCATWGKAKYVGTIVTIATINTFGGSSYSGYDVIFEHGESACYFESELEPTIKIGEQLVFPFMEEFL